jgi:hypothetical protein
MNDRQTFRIIRADDAAAQRIGVSPARTIFG